jgi:selenocysteine-specific elongation factor
VDAGLAEEVLARIEAEGHVERAGTRVRLAGHRVDLGAREGDARRVEAALAEGWPAPPTGADLGDRELLGALVETGRAVAISAVVYLLPDQAGRAEALARELAARPEGMTASAFRERLGTTRKFAIPILEWLDARGVTKREGDLRRLRPPASSGPASPAPASASPEPPR